MEKNHSQQFTYVDYLIVGAGPAGLQMAYFLKEAKRDHLVLEGNDIPASFYAKFPRQRRMISINKRFNLYSEKEFNLRHDWNSLLSDDEALLFTKYSEKLYPGADEVVRYMGDFAAKHQLNITFNTRITKVKRLPDGQFELATNREETYRCRYLLMATGAVKPKMPEVNGIDLVQGYHNYNADPTAYENKRVAIMGRGNSAFEVANNLAGHAAIVHVLVEKKVKHAWQTHYVGDLRAVNNTILDMYQLKSLHATVGFRVVDIEKTPTETYRLTVEEDLPHWERPGITRTKLEYDEVICCTGWKFVNMDIFDENCRPEMDAKDKYPVLDSSWESKVPNMYFIGTAMASRDRQSASGFIHGFRYNIRSLHHMLEHKIHHMPLPSKSFSLTSELELNQFCQYLIKRISTTSALYQMNTYLCDAMITENNQVTIYPELPRDYVLSREFFTRHKNLNLLTLEYGFQNYPKDAPALDFIHPADVDDISCSAFLHPIIRRYENGEYANKVLLGESLVVRYDHYDYEENISDVHKNSLMNFFNRQVGVTNKTFNETKYAEGTFEPYSAARTAEIKEMLAGQKTPCKFLV